MGGPNVAVSLLLIPPNCRDTSASSKKRTNAELLSLFNCNRKTPFLKHKNVNLKNLPEVKVVRTDFRRSKSINTTHLRQDIITTSFRHMLLLYRWISGRAVKSPPNIAPPLGAPRKLVGRYPKRVVIAKQVDPSAGLITCLSSVTLLQVSDLLNGPVALRAGSTCVVSR